LIQEEKWDGGSATFVHEINGDHWTMVIYWLIQDHSILNS
jgi:hypothetical protein